MKKTTALLALLQFLTVGDELRAQSLQTEIDSILNDGNAWSVLVQSDDAMVTYYRQNKDTERTPASNAKLVTTAAAFGLLGSDHAFETRVYTSGSLIGTTLNGDLNLVVEHDLTWNTYCLNSSDQALDFLAARIAQLGIQTVTGNINVYGAAYYGRGQFDDVRFLGSSYDNQTVATTFRTSLTQAGITVSGSGIGRTGFNAPGTLFHTHLSTDLLYDNEETAHAFLDEMPLTLAAANIEINRVSHNAMADGLLFHIGYKVSGVSTLAAGADAVRDWLENTAGIDTGDIVIGDGSGLARGTNPPGNEYSAQFFIDLLRYMTANHPGYDTTLAISCEDGTIGGRLCNAGMAGRVHAKTGTLFTTIALSGYMDHPTSGERIFFSFLANNSGGISSSATRANMDAALTTIANGFPPVIPGLSSVRNAGTGSSVEIHAAQQATGITSWDIQYSINDGPFSNSMALPLPVPYIIGTRTDQPNFGDYQEITGTWANTSATSQAPGLTGSLGGRWAVPNDGGAADVARFVPSALSGGRYEVDVTTYGLFLSDNAHQVTWRINDANGLRTGRTDLSFETTGDVWAPLAICDFIPGQGHYIEFDNSTQVNNVGTTTAGNSRMVMSGVRFMPTAAVATITGLNPGDRIDARLIARNGAQTSSASDTYSARVSAQPSRVLLIDGNDRWDTQGENTGGTSHDFVTNVASAMPGDLAFDAAENHAVIRGDVPLDDYDLVIWLLGEESTQDEAFSDTEQALVSDYMASGGRIIISGAEFGWDLEALGSSTDTDFLHNTLRIDYLADDTTAATAGLTPVNGDIFAGITNLAYDAGPMVIGFPDVLGGLAGARVVMNYQGTSEGAAVAWKDDPAGPGAVAFGFPVTMISSDAARAQLLDAAIDYLLQQQNDPDDLWMIR